MSAKATQPTPKPGSKSRWDLPAWYHRLDLITIKENRNIQPEDFDEDISDLEGKEEATDTTKYEICSHCTARECDGETDDDCECECEPWSDEEEEDSFSKRSYTGSDADDYYELKEQREERKQELRAWKLAELEDQRTQREYEQQKATEVQEAFERLKDDCSRGINCPWLDRLEGQKFDLFSLDHVSNDYDPNVPSVRYVEFSTFYNDNLGPVNTHPQPGSNFKRTQLRPNKTNRKRRRSNLVRGNLSLGPNTGCDIDPFVPPKAAGLQEYQLTSKNENATLSVCFISHQYLIVTVPQSVVLGNQAPDQSTPAPFKFAGIRYNYEKEWLERRARYAKRRRGSSPRESWFEMNHPMGFWKLPF